MLFIGRFEIEGFKNETKYCRKENVMAKEKAVMTNTRIFPSIKRMWSIMASDAGISMQDEISNLIKREYNFSVYFREQVANNRWNISEALFIEGAVLSWLAGVEAEAVVCGIYPPLNEFTFTEKGPMKGEELYKFLLDKKITEFKRQKLE